MSTPTYEFIASPNFSKRVKPVSAVIVHYTASLSIDGTIDWFKRSESQVSAHYVVGRDGRTVQMVADEHVAWHAGRSSMRPNLPDGDPAKEPNVNAFSIGIELVGTADSGFTDRQLGSLYELLQMLAVRYRIPPERVVGHSTIAPGRKIDPEGYDHQFPWAKTREMVGAAYQTTQPRSDATVQVMPPAVV